MALASEYTTLTAEGFGQICCPLKLEISECQNSRASPVSSSRWYQLFLLFKVAYKLRVIRRVTGPKAGDTETILPTKLATCLAERLLICLASKSLDLHAFIFESGTENLPTAKSI